MPYICIELTIGQGQDGRFGGGSGRHVGQAQLLERVRHRGQPDGHVHDVEDGRVGRHHQRRRGQAGAAAEAGHGV